MIVGRFVHDEDGPRIEVSTHTLTQMMAEHVIEAVPDTKKPLKIEWVYKVGAIPVRIKRSK